MSESKPKLRLVPDPDLRAMAIDGSRPWSRSAWCRTERSDPDFPARYVVGGKICRSLDDWDRYIESKRSRLANRS